MGVLTWSPADSTAPINSDFIYTPLNYSVSATYTPTNTEIIGNVTATFVPFNNFDLNNWLNLTPSFTDTTATVTITGSLPIDIFDQYRVTYVDKGKSDKIQTPITTTLDNVPDFKEVYKIDVDNRKKINIKFTVEVFIEDNLQPVTSFSKTYNFDVIQTYNMIKNWVDTYFSIRY